jgi:predicted RecA/RadA family phage recombinase
MRRVRARVIALSISSLLLSILVPISIPQATAAPALVTCVNIESGAERISRTGQCRNGREAQANWHKNQSDSAIASGVNAKAITICSNKESSPVTYQVIRKKCARHQVSTLFSRSGSLPAKPVIADAVSYGHDNASLKLADDPASGLDAPIAYYTINVRSVDTSTATKIESKRIYSWKDLGLIVGGLQGRTTYTFTVTATTVDGTSAVSIASIPVTTPAYVPPASTSSSSGSTLAVPAFTLSSTSETKIVNNAISGYTISSTGGTIASYAISPAAPAGITFNTATGFLSGTPTSTQSATTYTITATNASGSATATFALTVSSSAPSFTLSSNTETRVVTTALAGYTIDASAGAAITSYSLVGTLPSGLNFSTSNGRITGSPTESRTATTYTIIGTSASGETATATYALRVFGNGWLSRASAADNDWWGVAYGNGLFVAVGLSGTGNRVMTSPDGITWTSQSSAADNYWYGVTYGNGLFVAVGFSGSGNRIMTSPDGITWTTRNSQSDINWSSVIYGNGTFVAVANTGGTSRVITSTDGINWTLRTAASTNAWYSVTFGNGLFVAVSNNDTSGTGRVMTSTDGITWTARSVPSNNWYSVTFGNGLFVAVAQTGTGNRVMTSTDGINWTSRASAADSAWNSVAYGDGLFVAVAENGTGNRVMTSTDGINWVGQSAAATLSWKAVTYGNGRFVAVSNSGAGNRVMTLNP